jgi:hypothetical protein
MPKPTPIIFTISVVVATLAPAATASAALNLVNHNETLLLDASPSPPVTLRTLG